MLSAVRRIAVKKPHSVFFNNNTFNKIRPSYDLSHFTFDTNVTGKTRRALQIRIKDGADLCCVRRSFSSNHYPPHIVLKLPALSPTMDQGTVSSWMKQEGDFINEGDVVAEIETDKATMGVESDESGYLAKILIQAGISGVKIGTPICIIVEAKENIAAFKDYKTDVQPDIVTSQTTPAATSSPKVDTPPTSGSTPISSPPGNQPPSKRHLSQRKPSIDFNKFSKEEQKPAPPPEKLQPVAKSKPSKAKYTDHPVTNIRAVIAKRLVQSKSEIPHFYLSMDVNTNQLEAMRIVLNSELAQSGVKISVNDIIVKAAALACKQVPEANSTWMESYIRHYNTVDVSVAVSTPTGLITPIVFNADAKVLRDISKEIKDLAFRARQGKLKPHEFQGGTFTVSNLGMFGVNAFYAIINPPQSCILAVGTSGEKLFMKDTKISSIGVKKYIAVTLSCDHRVIDGAVAAEWLKAFRDFIEEPRNMF